MSNYIIIFLSSFLLWIMIGWLVLLWFIDGRVKKEQVLHALYALAISWIIGYILKLLFHTPRPFMVADLTPLTIFPIYDWSFPSNHTAMAFAIATTIWLHDKKIGSVFVIVAFLVGAGRVLSLVHYPVDILGGAIIGTLIAFTVERRHLFSITPKSRLK